MNKHIYERMSRVLVSYSEVPPEELEKFFSIFSVSKLNKDEHFIRAGEKPRTIGFVISGILRLYYSANSGTEFNKSFCVENDFVASYSALLRNEDSRLSIQALEETLLYIADFKDYANLLHNHFCWQVLSRKLAEDLFIKKEQRESQFLLDSAETRYLRFLEGYPGLEKRIKQYHIASYLGITPVALSRVRTKLGLN